MFLSPSSLEYDRHPNVMMLLLDNGVDVYSRQIKHPKQALPSVRLLRIFRKSIQICIVRAVRQPLILKYLESLARLLERISVEHGCCGWASTRSPNADDLTP